MSELSLLDKWRKKSIHNFTPLQASLELTNRCNERCGHCYIDSFKDDPQRTLTLEQWYHILQQLRQAGTLYLILMGGEAMLNPYFWQITKKSKSLGFHTSMISNGLKIQSEEMAEKLLESGIQQVTISLYSLNPNIHETMTSVRGSFAKTMNAILFCQKVGLKVSVNSLLTSLNISSIFDLEDWCVQNQLEIKVDPTVTSKLSGDMTPTRLRASRSQLEWYFSERKKRWVNGQVKASPESSGDFVCNAAKGKCAVTAYGELLPCIEVREPMGSLIDESFETLWNNPSVQPWRDMRLSDLSRKSETGFCEHCPGMAKNEVGDLHQELDFSVMLSEVKSKVSQDLGE